MVHTMTYKARKTTALLLALTLALLPFSMSLGSSMAKGDAFLSALHTDTTACSEEPDSPEHHQQTDQHNDAGDDDECCGDHCNAFSGAQICTGITQAIPVAHTESYTTDNSAWIPTPEPTLLLRPPLPLS